MKIGILGTRGIPNHYGGFEQWAEQLSQALVQRGYEVVVYNSHYHPYKKSDFNGVQIVHKWDPNKIGLASQFIYDYLCISDARKQKFDVIIQLGYTTSSVWAWRLPKSAKIIYNMDGMEWKREKYKGLLKPFLRYAEKLAVKNSDVVVADSKPIQEYYKNNYRAKVDFIAYPATNFKTPDKRLIDKFRVQINNYYLLIARFQPDNNLETVIKGVLESHASKPLLIVGDFNNKYGKFLRDKYENRGVVFLGGNFNKEELDNLRYFSSLYFHGHSAGGTNPSLLEAMATSCLICAHSNPFNRSVLGDDAFFFNNEKDIGIMLNEEKIDLRKDDWVSKNKLKIEQEYELDLIVDKYCKHF